MKTAIGILGGTFDPIHYGHLTPAREAMQALGLEHIRLMPNHIPPHRPQPVASSEQRLAMVTLAASEFGGFQVDDRELRRQSPSFTFDTLRQLRQLLAVTAKLDLAVRRFEQEEAWLLLQSLTLGFKEPAILEFALP